MLLVARLETSGRFGLRFLCAAWLIGSAEILRRSAPGGWPPERHLQLFVGACGASAVLGAILLWRTREDGAREMIESCAALGFWSGVFALLV
ncbi:MAG: hypothetical protein ABI682_07660 [Acidobacteriota bacterium]